MAQAVSSPSLIVVVEQATLDGDGRLSVSGWAAGREAVERVEIEIAGRVLGLAEGGLPRPDVAADWPDSIDAGACGFALSLRPDFALGEGDPVLALARGVGGAVASGVGSVTAAPQPSGETLGLTIDAPRLREGGLAPPVRRVLVVEGWAAAREGIAAVEAFLDGAPAGELKRGLRRRDIAAAFPDWPEALHSGFALILPRKAFSGDRQTLRIVARDRRGATRQQEIAVSLAAAGDDEPGLRRHVTQAETDFGLALIARAGVRPEFVVQIVPGEGSEATLASLRAQSYPFFQIDDAPPAPGEGRVGRWVGGGVSRR